MLYGTEGGVCRVKFDFLYRPAGWQSKIWQESSKNKNLRGHPTGRYKKSNFTRQTREMTVYFDFWPSPPPSVPYGLCTSLRPKWSFQDQGNGTLIGIDDVWVKKNISFRPRTKKM